MKNENAITWLQTYNDILRMSLNQLDEHAEDYESKKRQIEFDIQENNKLISQFQAQ